MEYAADARREEGVSSKSRLAASPSPAAALRDSEALGENEAEMTKESLDEVDDLVGH